jgi:hypothetical protein
LRHELGDSIFKTLPAGALGLYTYYERLAQGPRQLMAGSRKFSMEYIDRNDIAALTRDAAGISGIQHIMDVDWSEAEEIWGVPDTHSRLISPPRPAGRRRPLRGRHLSDSRPLSRSLPTVLSFPADAVTEVTGESGRAS